MESKRRAGAHITDTDTADTAEYKAAIAETALCQLLIEHFRRVAQLTTHATTTGHTDELADLYALAFAAAEIPPSSTATLTPHTARNLADRLCNELALGIVGLDLLAEPSSPATTSDDTLFRKSRAVVNEYTILDRARTVANYLNTFENVLAEHKWTADFTTANPTPIKQPKNN